MQAEILEPPMIILYVNIVSVCKNSCSTRRVLLSCSSNLKHKLRVDIDIYTYGVIYLITFEKCLIQNVGQTL
jgi:hypothetical protein